MVGWPARPCGRGSRRRNRPARPEARPSSSSQSAGPRSGKRACAVEPPAVRLAARRSGIVGQAAAGPRIGGAGVAVRRGQRLRRYRRGCRSRDRRGLRLQPVERGGIRSARSDWTSGSPSQSRPSQRRSSSIPSTNSGRQRPGRDPRSAAGSARRSPRAVMAEHRADRRGRDAAGRSERARSG